jgi:hypothetical protein
MIEQYLPNNNENATVAFCQKNFGIQTVPSFMEQAGCCAAQIWSFQ